MKILVLEDEQRAGEKLIDLIKAYRPSAEISWKRSIEGALQSLNQEKDIQLIFSDIELLDGNVFSMYERIVPPCPIIFCTAYNNYYTDAFQTNGIAYLLKPYTELQFKAAWDKYQHLFQAKQTVPELAPLLSFLKNKPLTPDLPAYKSTFLVKKKDGIFLLKTDNIAWLQSQGDFVLGHDYNGKKHLINHTLSELEELLNPQQFFRINRSEIIQMDSILKFNPYIKNRLAITLINGLGILYTSNSRAAEFRKWLG